MENSLSTKIAMGDSSTQQQKESKEKYTECGQYYAIQKYCHILPYRYDKA